MDRILAILLFFTFTAQAAETPEINCRPPSEHVFREKLSAWFHTEKLERELREVVAFSGNHERREQVRSLHRGTYFADRFTEEDLRRRMQAEFQSMVAADPRRAGAMANFPVRGASSELEGGEEGVLQIRAQSIPLADQKILAPEIRKKLGNSIRVSYHYPLDRYEYALTYEGEEMPFERVVSKIQDDYELNCAEFKGQQKPTSAESGGGRSQ